MPQVTIDLPESLKNALVSEACRTGESLPALLIRAAAALVGTPIHTLFQIATAGSLVEGVYSGAVTAKLILQYGNFGLGTFENLDGEMVVLEGNVYRIRSGGQVEVASLDSAAPFALVTEFGPSIDRHIDPFQTPQELYVQCDAQRSSDNIFYALRIDGEFETMRTRAVSNPGSGGLVKAATSQAEFEFDRINGTLVGFWSPGYSSAISIAGYHFHFLSDDRRHGGHLLKCSGRAARLRVQPLTAFHLALPENESFLKADLSKGSAADLTYAEQSH